MQPLAQEEHRERKELARDDHPGCLLSGFLLVNRYPHHDTHTFLHFLYYYTFLHFLHHYIFLLSVWSSSQITTFTVPNFFFLLLFLSFSEFLVISILRLGPNTITWTPSSLIWVTQWIIFHSVRMCHCFVLTEMHSFFISPDFFFRFFLWISASYFI